MDKKVFYDVIRPEVNLTTQNVLGMDKLLDYLEEVQPNLQQAAYEIATAWWETAQTMHPVREAYWLSETWRKNNLRYYPYYGRGLIQTTWKDNYRRLARLMNMPENTFVNKPDLLLEWKYALPALHHGMESGLYTGKDLDDYIDEFNESDEEDLREYKNARRIVNGTDKDDEIADLALLFEVALEASNFRSQLPTQSDSSTSRSNVPSETKTLSVGLYGLFMSILKILGFK